MRCATCGTENAPDSRFCGGCGAKQPGKTAPTAKILDDASYPPTGQPPSGPPSIPPSSYGHGPASIPPPVMPTPAPGSMVQRSQPSHGSIPPTSDPSRHISRPPDVSRHVSPPPSQQRPNISAPDVSRAPAVSGDSIALPPSRPIALIAIVLVVDLGLAAAGAVMLAKGLANSEAKVEDKAPKKTEAQMPAPPEEAPAAAAAAPPAEAPAAAAAAPPAEAPTVPSVPSASAITSVTAPAEPASVPAAKPASAAADKSTASRRGKEKERTATTTPAPTTTTTKPDPTTSSGPVTSPSSTSPQDPYADATPAPKLTTEQEVSKLAASSKGAFDRCAAAAQAHGQIQIAFQVLADGRVANAAAVENSTGNTELGRCLVATISGWTLSPHSGPTQSFVRPFNYP